VGFVVDLPTASRVIVGAGSLDQYVKPPITDAVLTHQLNVAPIRGGGKPAGRCHALGVLVEFLHGRRFAL
jgi:hypothetical protein